MPLNINELKRRAKSYVEIEANTKVMRISFVKRHVLFDKEDVVLSIITTDNNDCATFFL